MGQFSNSTYKHGILVLGICLFILGIYFSQLSVFAQLIDATPAVTTPTTSPTPTPLQTPVTMPVPTLTQEPDTTSPVFISIDGISAEPTTAVIAWTTDELAYGHIEYGPTVSYGSTTTKSVLASLEQVQILTSLNPSTIYHYRIVAIDEAGNVSYSDDQSVITASEPEIVDTDPPVISDITVSNITEIGATINLTTDELALAKVEYGSDENYGLETPMSADFSDTNSFDLTSLQGATTYHYRVIAQDASGNESVSPDETFTTHSPATPNSTPSPSLIPAPTPSPTVSITSSPSLTTTSTPTPSPTATLLPSLSPTPTVSLSPVPIPGLVVSNIEVVEVSSSSAIIVWTTSIPADGRILFGTSAEYGSQVNSIYSQATSHQVILTNLQTGTNYHYQVVTTAGSLTVRSDNYEFNTLFEPVVVEPSLLISNVAVAKVATSSAMIIWDTNQPANSQIIYGKTSGYGFQTSNELFSPSHSISLVNLEPSTTYHYIASSTNAAGDSTVYEDKVFTTAAILNAVAILPAPVPEIVYNEDQDLAANPPAPVRLPNGGGYGQPPLHAPLSKIIKVEALDSQVVFIWKNPVDMSKLADVLIVRKEISEHFKNARNGKVVYRGKGTTFTDTGLENGKTYTYGFFTKDAHDLRSSGAVLYKVKLKAKKVEIKLPMVPKAVQRTPLFKFSSDIVPGIQGSSVKHLQLILAQEPGIYPEGRITGVFDLTMIQAVLRFQKKYKLPATGFVDTKTRRKLESLSLALHLPDIKFNKATSFPENIYLGKKGIPIESLQKFLIEESVYPEKLITGYFGPLTKKAVIRFQVKNAIEPASGFVGPITRSLIESIQKARKIKF